MEYFFYCRDIADSRALRKRIVETHWSFMDGYAGAMIARGPTLADDRVTQTGSMHIVDLPDAEAARVFAYEEPNYRNGVYREVMVRRWRNVLGGKMWDFKSDPGHNQRFLVIGHGKPGMSTTRNGLLDEHHRYFIDKGYLPHFIVRGPLLSDDGKDWIGSAMLVEFPDRAAVEAMLAGEPYAKAGLYENIEIHNWRFGGRH
jgi:uncharacterized protein YciI